MTMNQKFVEIMLMSNSAMENILMCIWIDPHYVMIMIAPLFKSTDLFIIKKIDGKSSSFLLNYLLKAIKMGNTPPSSKEYEPEQPLEQGMRKFGIPLGQKIPIKGPFFIEGHEPNDEIYRFDLSHLDSSGLMTPIFSFETFDPLRDTFNVVNNGSIVKFVFETDSFEKELIHSLEFEFDFSKSFRSEKESYQQLKSIPFLLPNDRKMIRLEGKYWYYIRYVNGKFYEFFIVESPDETSRGFDSVFKKEDVVIQKINVDSSNVPFVMNDEEGNLIITSADEGFVPIPIRLPSDDIHLADFLSQETFQ